MEELIAYNISVLEKIEELLEQVTDAELAHARGLLFGSSIGQHFRHILEFYACLLNTMDAPTFSYDRRERNMLIEQVSSEARASARASRVLLGALVRDRDLVMESELPGSSTYSQQHTTLKRELAYLADHGVHHLAMVRIALEQELPHVTFPSHLGVAASTRNHQER